MIPIFIPLTISFVILCASGNRKVLKILSGIICLIFAVIVCLFINRKDDIVDKIPFTSIDESSQVVVEKDGVMYIESDYSGVLKNEYVLTGDFDEDDVSEWLSKVTRAVNIHIKSKDKVIWSHSIGVVDSDSVSEIQEIYETWLNDGTVPKDKIRYEFLCFYLDV